MARKNQRNKLSAKKRKFIMVPIEREMYNEIRKICLKQGLSINDVVRKAILEYLESANAKDCANEVFHDFGRALRRGNCQTNAVGSFIKQKAKRE